MTHHIDDTDYYQDNRSPAEKLRDEAKYEVQNLIKSYTSYNKRELSAAGLNDLLNYIDQIYRYGNIEAKKNEIWKTIGEWENKLKQHALKEILTTNDVSRFNLLTHFFQRSELRAILVDLALQGKINFVEILLLLQFEIKVTDPLDVIVIKKEGGHGVDFSFAPAAKTSTKKSDTIFHYFMYHASRIKDLHPFSAIMPTEIVETVKEPTYLNMTVIQYIMYDNFIYQQLQKGNFALAEQALQKLQQLASDKTFAAALSYYQASLATIKKNFLQYSDYPTFLKVAPAFKFDESDIRVASSELKKNFVHYQFAEKKGDIAKLHKKYDKLIGHLLIQLQELEKATAKKKHRGEYVKELHQTVQTLYQQSKTMNPTHQLVEILKVIMNTHNQIRKSKRGKPSLFGKGSTTADSLEGLAKQIDSLLFPPKHRPYLSKEEKSLFLTFRDENLLKQIENFEEKSLEAKPTPPKPTRKR